jgi:hypothetical protein
MQLPCLAILTFCPIANNVHLSYPYDRKVLNVDCHILILNKPTFISIKIKRNKFGSHVVGLLKGPIKLYSRASTIMFS